MCPIELQGQCMVDVTRSGNMCRRRLFCRLEAFRIRVRICIRTRTRIRTRRSLCHHSARAAPAFSQPIPPSSSLFCPRLLRPLSRIYRLSSLCAPMPPLVPPRQVFRARLGLPSAALPSSICMSLCPPPRMSSPQLVPAALPSPPPFPRRISSRQRLHLPPTLDEPPIPPRLVGSPLLEKLTHQPSTISPKVQQQLWFDGDEFGTRRTGPAQTDSPMASPLSSNSSSSSSSPPATPRTTSSRRAHRRSPSVAYNRRTRSHSPPPPPPSSAVPPVPPIPSSAFDSPGARRSVLRSPPTTPSRARAAAQIIIPDLGAASPSSALSPYASRTLSPRRRGLGYAYREELPPYGHGHGYGYGCSWRPADVHFARGRAGPRMQGPGTK
ncbi:hypothetical protein C8Q79DRAFT_380630 [Trametes meyenii]|nr:hypothetical protein C8Q79DRAFT_380630 [Trametes meyenii]